jgi:hypothetical protein
MALNEYGARALGKICAAALAEVQEGKGKLVNYQQLPETIWPALMEYWNIKCSADGAARMMNATQWNAKNPVLPFEADSQVKRDTAPAELRGIAHQWLDGIYQQLESQRSTSGFR